MTKFTTSVVVAPTVVRELEFCDSHTHICVRTQEAVGFPIAALILTEDRRLLLGGFGTGLSPDATANSRSADSSVGGKAGVSAFKGAFGEFKLPEKAAKGAETYGDDASAQKAMQDLFDVPSHVLPSVLTLCPSFLGSLLEQSEPRQ